MAPTHDSNKGGYAAAHSKSRSAGIAYAPAYIAAARIAQRAAMAELVNPDPK